MKVWLNSQNIRLHTIQLPPMYAWPPLVKQVILLVAIGACLGVYLLLIISLVGASLLWFS
jgi:hypothetical protein